MRQSTEIKVGIVVVLALVLFLGGFEWIRSFGQTRDHFKVHMYFLSVGRLAKGAPVRLAGARIGEAAEIKVIETPEEMKQAFLAAQPTPAPGEEAPREEPPPQVVRVTCRIQRDQQIYDTYEARVMTPLIGPTEIVIEPKVGARPGKLLGEGDSMFVAILRPADAAEAAMSALGEVEIVAKNINKILGKKATQESVERSMADLQKALEGFSKISTTLAKVISGREKELDATVLHLASMAARVNHTATQLDALLSEQKLHNDIKQTMSDVRTSAENIRIATEGVSELLSPENREGMQQTLHNIEQISQSVQQITDEALKFASDPENTRNIQRTLAAAADAAEKLNVIADDVRRYTSDEERQKQLTTILDSVEVASKRIASASEQIDNLVNSKRFMRNVRQTVAHAEAIGQSTRELLDANTREDVQETLRAVREIAANLQDTSAEIRRLITGTEVTSDLEQTVIAMREASDNIRAISEKVRGVIEAPEMLPDVQRAVHNAAELGDSLNNALGSDVRISEELSYSIRTGQAINVVDVDLFRRRGSGLTVGMYGVGIGGDFFKLQGVSRWRDNLLYTYGIYKDHPGVGLRYDNSSYRVEADLYNANLPTVDLKASYFVSDGLKVIGRCVGLGKAAPQDWLFGLGYEF